MLLDEPFTGIDERTTRRSHGLVEQWRVERRTVIAVLHDLAPGAAHFRADAADGARAASAGGATLGSVSRDNLMRAGMPEAWDEHAAAWPQVRPAVSMSL